MRKVPFIGYPGSFTQQNYSEDIEHGYLVWDVDVPKRTHEVEFVPLPNIKPFVTIDWAGSVDETCALASRWPNDSRFRIRSLYQIPTSDAATISVRLKADKNATEVVFHSDDSAASKQFVSASRGIDVRSLDAVEGLLREYYAKEKLDDQVWREMRSTLASAHASATKEEDVERGTVWTIESLEFDNLYGYGAGNVLKLSDRKGIVGILGPNKIGKSSIVGAISYTLFNSSDRDINKNLHAVNVDRRNGSGVALLNVGGSRYEVRRNTSKLSCRGMPAATTTLSLRQLDGRQVDLTAEERLVTEKKLRRLIGGYEDFAMTAGQMQDDVSRFLREGSANRKAILARFLGIDVFERIFAAANAELTEARSKLKNLPTNAQIVGRLRHHREVVSQTVEAIREVEAKSSELERQLAHLRGLVLALAPAYANFMRSESSKQARSRDLERERRLEQLATEAADLLVKRESELVDVDSRLAGCRSWELIDAERELLSSARLKRQEIVSARDAGARILERDRKLALKLAEVPCGDAFPSCVYIRDAHEAKARLGALEDALEGLERKLSEARAEASSSDVEAETLRRRSLEAESVSATRLVHEAMQAKAAAERELSTHRESMANRGTTQASEEDERAYRQTLDLTEKMSSLEGELAELRSRAKQLEREMGKSELIVSQTEEQQATRQEVEASSRARELVVNAFSRRGIPNAVLNRLLPALNVELQRVLEDVVGFRVALRADDDLNTLEILLDDGERTRPLELGSGMERFVGSLALRIALTNVTTLPKPDFMIIDEGFGALDEINAVSCVALLRSLRRWFRFVLVISHVELIKEAVDNVIEVQRDATGFARIAT